MSEQIISEVVHSPTLGAFAKALAKAQSQMGGAKKTAQNPHLKNKYPQLEDVIDAVGPLLNANGIAYTQLPFTAGKEFVGIVTVFIHESGEYMASKVTMPVAKTDAQGHGSGYTYLRRYSLMAMSGIAPTDDDGNAATGRAPELVKAQVQPISNEEELRIGDMLDAANDSASLAKADGEAARVAKAGGLTEESRARLREKRKAAVARVDRLTNGAVA